ncbi:hypothetical protein NL676_020449 [Syzygium grande]|nr:hypothetical protein NL676_020449 [Syzygium grande]
MTISTSCQTADSDLALYMTIRVLAGLHNSRALGSIDSNFRSSLESQDEYDSDVMLKNFMPFGSGMKQCAGAEYARAFLSTFLHVLVMKYRWTNVKKGEIRRNPILSLGDGWHIKIMERQK